MSSRSLKSRPVGRAQVTHVGLFYKKYIALHKVYFSLVMGLSFLVLRDFQTLYTDAQILQLGIRGVCVMRSINFLLTYLL